MDPFAERATTYRISIVDDCADTGVDNRLQERSGIGHPVSSSCKVVINRVARFLPGAVRANDRHERRVREERGQVRWVRIRVLRQDVVHVVVACERAQDLVVAERLRLGARRRRARLVARLDLVLTAAGAEERAVRGAQGLRGHQRVVPARTISAAQRVR